MNQNIIRMAVAAFLRSCGGLDTGAWKVTQLPGDASNRSYFRVVEDETGRSFMVMKLASEPFASEEGQSGRAQVRRLPFVEVAEYLDAGRIAVPRIYVQDMENGFLLLEDLGDLTLERALASGRERQEMYHWAIDVLVDMQAWTWSSPALDNIAFQRVFDRELLLWEFEHFYEWGLVELTGRTPDSRDAAEIRAFFEDVVGRLTGLRQGFVHRDFQSRNLMIQQGRMRVIDFQDALTGPFIYDLVALLRDSYVRFDKDEIRGYLEYYLQVGRPLMPWLPEIDELVTAFHLQALQRKLKDAGRFVYIDRVKGNPKFLPNIGQSLAYVNEAFDALPEYTAVRSVLGRYLPEHFRG